MNETCEDCIFRPLGDTSLSRFYCWRRKEQPDLGEDCEDKRTEGQAVEELVDVIAEEEGTPEEPAAPAKGQLTLF